jgi:glycine cleavage system H protein
MVEVNHVPARPERIRFEEQTCKGFRPGCYLHAVTRMDAAKPKTLFYKRSHFVTHLPVDYLYSPSHFWLAKQEGEVWRVGITKFANRMLGDMVDCGFELPPGAAVGNGEIIGWMEGFKAISDIYCVLDGTYLGVNPLLKEKINVVDKDSYGNGWIYEASGVPDARCVDVQAYKALLDETIDRILEKQKGEETK